MKVMLINPPYDAAKYYGKLKQLRFIFPPVGLLYIASYIRDKGVEVYLFDFETSEKAFISELQAFMPDIIGITCQTALVKSTLQLCKEIKSIRRDVPIVVGGHHPTSRPQDLLKSSLVDYVVRGEGEVTFLELIEKICSGVTVEKVKGISYMGTQNDIITTPGRELIRDIDQLPMMAIDLLPIEKFHTSPDLMLGRRTALISTSRGCPNECIFCAVQGGFRHNKYRTRSVENIFKEIDYYRDRYNIDSLFIMDDTFTLNKKKVMDFCNKMISLGYNKEIKWWAQTRVDTVTSDLLVKMREAGCEIISYGLESGVQRILDNIKKRTKLDKVKTITSLSREAGLNVRASFILGLPGESFLDSLKTIYFGLTLPLNRVKFGLATPYPGTELWDIALTEGLVNDEEEDWDRFTQMAGFTSYDPSYIPRGRHATELKVLQVLANALFYIKPRIFCKIFIEYARKNLLKKFFKSVYVYLRATLIR
ncbi:MAG: cobalamin-dependent protein [Bacteriovoracaceae bacterium]|nr:cobalamin-dependent protein [Bacteriovoracaceae bacterium]